MLQQDNHSELLRLLDGVLFSLELPNSSRALPLSDLEDFIEEHFSSSQIKPINDINAEKITPLEKYVQGDLDYQDPQDLKTINSLVESYPNHTRPQLYAVLLKLKLNYITLITDELLRISGPVHDQTTV